LAAAAFLALRFSFSVFWGAFFASFFGFSEPFTVAHATRPPGRRRAPAKIWTVLAGPVGPRPSPGFASSSRWGCSRPRRPRS